MSGRTSPLRRLRGALGTLPIAWALGACAARGGLPPLFERETGLPGDVTEERLLFGLAERHLEPSGARVDAIRPLVVRAETGEGTRTHFLPPIGRHLESDRRISTSVYPLFFRTSMGSPEERERDASDDDTYLFPLLAWGDEPGRGAHFLLFPFGGNLKQKLLADEIEFYAFPLYARTRVDDWSSHHVLWPLVAWGESDERSHFRVLPFWSRSDSPTQSKRSVLWPVVHWGTDRRRDGRTFDGWFVFPLLGRRTSREGDFSSWTALYPFFQWSEDRRTGDRHHAVLWPVHKRTVRPGESESTWWWPAYGEYRSETEASEFYAWPIVWDQREVAGGRRHERFYVVPLWMRSRSGPLDGPPDEEELRSWPLFSWQRSRGGRELVRVPEIVPFFGWGPGETAWADLVTVFRFESDAEGRAAWDGPLGAVRFRRDARGASALTLLWWIEIGLGNGSANDE